MYEILFISPHLEKECLQAFNLWHYCLGSNRLDAKLPHAQ